MKTGINDPMRQIQPLPAEVDALIALYNARRYEEAESRARSLLGQYPDFGFAWQLLGGSLQMQGKDALHAFRRTAELMPDDAVAHYNLGVVLKNSGQYDSAVTSYQRAIKLKPDYAEAHSNLGNVLKDLGRLGGAVASFRRALKLKPDSADAHNNLGTALKDLGQLDDAVDSYRRALALKPGYALAYYNLGNALKELGQLDNAVTSYRQAIKIKPDFADANNNLGATLKDLGQLDAALDCYRRVLEQRPGFAEAHNNLGIALKDLGQLDDALASCRRAVELKPDYAEAHSSLGNTLQDMGQLDDAMTSFRRALELDPDLAITHSNLLFCLNHSETVTAQALFAEHCRFAEQFETPLRANWPQHGNSRDPARCLQVGFVSGDLCNHAVANFMEPMLVHLAQYPKLSLHAYYNHSAEDSVTQRLKGYLTHWHSIAGLSDDALAQKIRDDGIDILIDLSGHTARNRLLTFARKPAPIQISWIGYPSTTGLQAMDYRIKSKWTEAVGALDDQYTEKLIRLPFSSPFEPYAESPDVNALPALSKGYVTFGSFNRPSKISKSSVQLWARVLQAVPASHLLLGSVSYDLQAGFRAEFDALGIAAERLSFHSRTDMKTYLGLHGEVDILLDTFPYGGGTTTNHALWMGLPILTYAGATPPQRIGAEILGASGMLDWVVRTPDEYVAKAFAAATDLPRLARLRATLRERIASTPSRLPEDAVRVLYTALNMVWRRWCAGLPTESFEVSSQDVDSAMREAGK